MGRLVFAATPAPWFSPVLTKLIMLLPPIIALPVTMRFARNIPDKFIMPVGAAACFFSVLDVAAVDYAFDLSPLLLPSP